MPWRTFAVLYAGALIGAAGLMPYSLRLIAQTGRSLKISTKRFVLLSIAQNALLFAAVIVLGLLASRAVGHGAPYIAGAFGRHASSRPIAQMMTWSIGLASVAGVFLLILDLILIPQLPALLDLARKTSISENFAASFYGGVNEELLFRLLGLSSTAWLLSRLWHTPAGQPTETVFWSANILIAILFGLEHLPAVRAMTGRVTVLAAGRSMVLNGPVALVCGWLFWQFGIEAAVAAHFVADLIYHVGGTLLLRANDRFGVLPWCPRQTSI